MYAIMVMTALGCGLDIICWKPIKHMAQYSTMEECQFFLHKVTEPGRFHVQCRPVEAVYPGQWDLPP